MTNQNEKKDESKPDRFDWLLRAVSEGEQELAQYDTDIEDLLGKINDWTAKLKEEQDKERRLQIITNQRFLLDQAMILSEIVTTKTLLYGLIIKVFQKGDLDVEAARKRFDEHIAKRTRQLFSDTGHEAMYGAM